MEFANLALAIEPANCALLTPPFLIVTAPDVTLKSAPSNEAIPLFDEVASSPDTVVPDISIPSPPVNEETFNASSSAFVANRVPPAVVASCTRNVLLVVSNVISPAAPVKELFCVAVPLLNCNVVGILYLKFPIFSIFI